MVSRAAIAVSDELIALCQAQLGLLAQTAGAVWCAVYLAEPEATASSPNLIPIAIYPDSAVQPPSVPAPAALPETPLPLPAERTALPASLPESAALDGSDRLDRDRRQFVLPLLHGEIALGLLVARRSDRGWNRRELALADRVARTLALASWLDRQQHWYRQRLDERDRLLAQQRDRLGDLLHQLRNPMTALRTFSKLLLKRLRADERSREVATSIVRESDRLQDLLREFDGCLDAMQADRPALPGRASPKLLLASAPPPALLQQAELEVGPLAIAAVLTPLAAAAAAIAEDRQLEFQSEIPANLSPARGNARALREVFSNLLDNALKYTPSGGSVRLMAGLHQIDGEQTWQGTAVCDTGVGIPAADREHLFERHYRGVQAEGTIEGSGLGLAIARDLVEQMGGRIELHSPAPSEAIAAAPHPGPGSQFIVWLPVAA